MLQHKHTLVPEYRAQHQHINQIKLSIPFQEQKEYATFVGSLVRHTFLAPIQKLYQSLGPVSSSKKHSSMSEQFSKSNPERKKKYAPLTRLVKNIHSPGPIEPAYLKNSR